MPAYHGRLKQATYTTISLDGNVMLNVQALSLFGASLESFALLTSSPSLRRHLRSLQLDAANTHDAARRHNTGMLLGALTALTHLQLGQDCAMGAAAGGGGGGASIGSMGLAGRSLINVREDGGVQQPLVLDDTRLQV